MSKTRVMVVDDQSMTRQLFALSLASSETYEVVRLVDSAAHACPCMAETPVDLVLMDILMQDGSNGLDAAANLKAQFPQVKIIAITSMAEASWLRRAREIGIDSFWYKELSEETILDVMDRTMAGESVYPDCLPRIPLGLSFNTEFTQRELDVLRWMTKGLSNGAIAKKLNISENTVKVHIRHMLNKTGYENRTELAIQARVSGVAVSVD